MPSFGQENDSYVIYHKEDGAFALSTSGVSTPFVISSNDFPGVHRVAKALQNDILNVTGTKPQVTIDTLRTGGFVLIGTLGKNPLIDALVREKKLDGEGIAGKRETFVTQIVDHPFLGVDRILVIAGSDKRGTIYGMFDLSRNIGVSPWYWWADVPVTKHTSLFVLPGRHSLGEPKVKYRGIFINDEAPALWGWASEKFGGFNHKFYEHVFELILRLKGNFLWPAMWGHAFNDDDPENPKLANEYGIVMSTSHHEPMMRAQDEWRRYGHGPWNYEKNDSILRAFWTEGIRRMDGNESVITLAMRGDGDVAMSPTANVSLLERIVSDQRAIIADVTGKDVTTIPQVWALYKEVQEYYDKGMRVPDDVTVLLCDDNWGNIRKLPTMDEKPRKGGYGIYYHFDYVGGPRNYKWLNTNQIARVWEQMHLAYEYNARQIWIVNVGDIKPMEFPISFFLDYAWDPDAIGAQDLPAFTRRWAEQQFGSKYANDIADILTTYTTYNSRRKPELLNVPTYSLEHYREAETVVNDYNALAARATEIGSKLPNEFKDAYYQLVLHPVTACANLNALYFTAAKNHLYAKQGRAATNDMAGQVKKLFTKDSLISYYYNHTMAGGKWNHIMDQTHIGYTYWQQPDYNTMPRVDSIPVPQNASMGIAIEGSGDAWPNDSVDAVLPEFDPFNRQSHYIEIFNKGQTPFSYTVLSGKPWIHITQSQGTVYDQVRVWVSIDWDKVPKGRHTIPLTIVGPMNVHEKVTAVTTNPSIPDLNRLPGFIESNGYVSMEAEHYTRAVGSDAVSWLTIPDLGRTLSAVTPMPVTAPAQTPGGNSPHLEYSLFLSQKKNVTVDVYCSPTLNFHNKDLRYAVSFDNQKPQIISLYGVDEIQDWKYPNVWSQAVANNIRITASNHEIKEPGQHTLKFWMVDPGIDLQKIVVDAGGVKQSYLGPPESYRTTQK